MTEENRRENLALAVEKAREALTDAELLFQAGRYANATALAYYGAFHRARALLLMEGEQPRTHGGLIQRLNLLFVRQGRMAPEISRLLSLLEAQRLQATYDTAAVFTSAMAEEALEDSRRFGEAAESLLRGSGYLG